jgi:hypothetical protein
LAHYQHVGVYAGQGTMWDANNYNRPVQLHTLKWEEHSLKFVGGVRYWKASTAPPSTSAPVLRPGLGGGGASTWSPFRLDAWVEQLNASGGSNLGHIFYDSAHGWYPWETIPEPQMMASQPAVVSWSVGRIDVFARGQAGDLIHTWLDSGIWHPWESFGGCIIGAPTVTSWGAPRLDVFVEGCSPINGSNLFHIWSDSNGWHPWELLPANQIMASSPSAVAWSSGRIDLLARGVDGSLIHGWVDTSWHLWESMGGCVVGTPAASSWGPNRLDGWAQACTDSGANFVHIWFGNGSWHPFEVVPGNQRIAGILGVTSWAAGRIDMFTRNPDGRTLDHWWYDAAWHGPENFGGSIAS